MKRVSHGAPSEWRRRSVLIPFLMMAFCIPAVYGSSSWARHSDRAKPVARRYLNTAPGVGYVGSKVCGKCHTTIYQSYIHTDMAHSMSLPAECPEFVNPRPPVTVYDQKLNQYFKVFRRGSVFYETKSLSVNNDGLAPTDHGRGQGE